MPDPQESPIGYAERLGLVHASAVSQDHKKKNGQFFTPVEIAEHMASLSRIKGRVVRILDPGCGAGILTCALAEHLAKVSPSTGMMEFTAYETDPAMVPVARQTLEYLVRWLEERNITASYRLCEGDFILAHAFSLQEDRELFKKSIQQFDIIISNPPYFKLPIRDPRVQAARLVVKGHPNIYSLFMAVSAALVREGGELIFITPRSYASGGYFTRFREYFFRKIQLTDAHLFVSRKETFGRDKVLQETVIIRGEKSSIAPEAPIRITSSGGIGDLKEAGEKIFPYWNIVDLYTAEKIFYLPTSDYEEAVLEIFRDWNSTMKDYGIQISTGRVVSFRAREFIHEVPENTSVVVPENAVEVLTGVPGIAPLYWLHNVQRMELQWPVPKPGKGQYMEVGEKSGPLLIPDKNYIFLRRFSSKDDQHRLVAAPYFPPLPNDQEVTGNGYIGVENKVNYIYRPSGHLERNEVLGLCALLNSQLFDTFFRIFNGNVNVSATELRAMPLPPLEIIHSIGNEISRSGNESVENADRIVKEYFQPVISQ